MADVQLENGYIKIAMELYEALAKIRINGEARQVLDTIIRKTYGWQKKEDNISLSQFNLATGLKRPNICKALKKLTIMNLIITQKDNGIVNIYRLNKDFDTWKPLPKKIILPKKIMVLTQKDNKSLPKKIHTIDTSTIDTITKDKTFSLTSNEVRLSELLLSLIIKRNATHKKPNIQTWAKEIDRMIRIDKREAKDIEKIIEWCQSDAFWQNNILSTKKLREKYDQLKLKSQDGENKDDMRLKFLRENKTT